MRGASIILVCLFFTSADFSSYYFECNAEIEVTDGIFDDMLSFTVLSTKACGNHLATGDEKRIRYVSKLKRKPQQGGKYKIIYRYLVPECLEKDGKPVDCRRETIELVK